jgi:hypothetical protein
MKYLLIVVSSFFIPIFSGCYTQLLMNRNEPNHVTQRKTADTVSYVYFPQNKLVPIHGWAPAAEGLNAPATDEVAPEPQSLELWPTISYPVVFAADPPPNLVAPVAATEFFYFPAGTPQSTTPQTTTAATAPEMNVRRTSGVQRAASPPPASSSTDETTRNSGMTRRGRR